MVTTIMQVFQTTQLVGTHQLESVYWNDGLLVVNIMGDRVLHAYRTEVSTSCANSEACQAGQGRAGQGRARQGVTGVQLEASQQAGDHHQQ